MILAGILLGIASVALRLLPHAPNIAPIAALALFAGAYFPKRWGWILPIGTMLVSDFVIGFYDPLVMATVYGSFLLNTLLGIFLRNNTRAASIGLAGITGAFFFFLTTNFAVWIQSDWYPHTVQGLMLSYTLALPFFRNTLFGDVFYSGIFFGGYALFKSFFSIKKRTRTITYRLGPLS